MSTSRPKLEIIIPNPGIVDLYPYIKWTVGKRYNIERLLKDNLNSAISLGPRWQGRTHSCTTRYDTENIHIKLNPTVVPDRAGIILDTENTCESLTKFTSLTPRAICLHVSVGHYLRAHQDDCHRHFSSHAPEGIGIGIDCVKCGMRRSDVRFERDQSGRPTTIRFRTRRSLIDGAWAAQCMYPRPSIELLMEHLLPDVSHSFW